MQIRLFGFLKAKRMGQNIRVPALKKAKIQADLYLADWVTVEAPDFPMNIPG